MTDLVTLFLARKDDVTPADKKAAVGEYGDVTYADEENKKYPLDTERHIRSAWSYINMPKNAAKYDDGGKAVKRRIIAAWKKKIDKAGPPAVEQNTAQFFLMDSYVSTKPGDPYRLFKFGRIYKNGVAHDITPESAKQFKLPHFDPPIKLGSHEDAAPAGGHIKRLEVREDGLWAIPEMTDKGAKALADGDYRYQSPEVIWESGAIEDPKTGELMPGPFIVGDALLHTPHLGNEAALYSYEPQPIEEGDDMNGQSFTVPQSLWDKFQAWMDSLGNNGGDNKSGIDPEKYAAAIKEQNELKAKVDAMEAAKAHESEVMSIVTDLHAERFGAMFKSEVVAKEAAEIFSTMKKEQRDWVLQKFAALAGQIDFANSVIGKEFGIETRTETDPVAAFTAVIADKQKSDKLSFSAALKAASAEHPDMAEAYNTAMQARAKRSRKEE